MEHEITVSYGQICVFDPALDAPCNAWTEAHVAQGFSWRPGSVSFAVGDDTGAVSVEVGSALSPPDVDAGDCAIRVPFVVPHAGIVEVGSILTGLSVSMPPGPYALYFLTRVPIEAIRIVFVPGDDIEPAVLCEGPYAKAQERYLMVAKSA